jgi:hypothetical protein
MGDLGTRVGNPLFAVVTGINPDMAMRIYYSAHSFKGRVAMFRSALVASKATPRTKEIVRLILNKVTLYSVTRNVLAHDLPSFDTSPASPTFGQLRIIDAKAQFQTDEVKRVAVDASLTLADIHNVSVNFDRLARIIWWCWCDVIAVPDPLLKKYPELLDELPDRPFLKAQSRPPE